MSAANLRAVTLAFADALRPPPKQSMAEWCDEHVRLSSEDSAKKGKFVAWPFQREPMDCMSPVHRAEKVVLLCGSQTMKTRLCMNLVAFAMKRYPGPILFVEPTAEDAESLSKDRMDTMIRDMPVLHDLVFEAKSRDKGNTISHKKFPGGHITFAFATAPSKLAMRPIRYLIYDEVSRYNKSAGKEGDPVRLGEKRTVTFWNRKIIYASSPGNDGDCRITEVFEYSDQRDWYVPCPKCGHFQVIKWSGIRFSLRGEPVVHMLNGEEVESIIPLDQPHYQCVECRELISERYKAWMNDNGQWIAGNPEGKYPGFRISGLVSPVREWADIVQEWVEIQGKPEQIKVFVNTVLAETYREQGEVPDYEKLHLRAQTQPRWERAPMGVLFITAGVDVQGDRVEVQIIGWGKGKRSWLLDYVVIPGRSQDLGDPSSVLCSDLERLLYGTIPHENGYDISISRIGIDSGFATQDVYSWARRQPPGRVIVCKGYDHGVALLGTPKAGDTMADGKRKKRGVKVWPVNVSMAKAEVYAWLKLTLLEDGSTPPGWVEFYDAGVEYFKQLCAEQWITRIVKGFRKGEWAKMRDRNEALDTRNMARAAAEHFGISRWSDSHWQALEKAMDSGTVKGSPKHKAVKTFAASSEAEPVVTSSVPPKTATKKEKSTLVSSTWIRNFLG